MMTNEQMKQSMDIIETIICCAELHNRQPAAYPYNSVYARLEEIERETDIDLVYLFKAFDNAIAMIRTEKYSMVRDMIKEYGPGIHKNWPMAPYETIEITTRTEQPTEYRDSFYAWLSAESDQLLGSKGIGGCPLGRGSSESSAIKDLVRRANMDAACKNIRLTLKKD